MNELTQTQLLTLRALVAATSVSAVVEGLAELCRERSTRVRTEGMASELRQVAGLLNRTAETPVLKYLPNVI